MRVILTSTMLLAMYTPALAAVTSSTQHSTSSTGLDGQIAVGDLISGKIATELPGDMGWHPAVSDPLDKLPAFTDDAGIRGTGLTGLMNDFPGDGNPAKIIRYDFSGPTDIGAIQVLTGNNGRDGRIYSTFAVYTSTDNDATYNLLGYFESDPLGSVNNANTPDDVRWGSTLVKVFDNASATLASGVTNMKFNLYAVDNTQGQYVDPFIGVNPFTGLDDLSGPPNPAQASPLVLEIDVLPVPEPASAALVLFGLCGVAGVVQRRRSSC
jgi:PEP-CTERM motif